MTIKEFIEKAIERTIKCTPSLCVRDSIGNIFSTFSSHWRTRHRVKNLYNQSIAVQVRKQMSNKEIKTLCDSLNYPVEVSYTFKWRVRPLDCSNTPLKLAEDSLVRVGIFPDDSTKYIRGVRLYSEKGDKGQKGDWVEVEFPL